MSDRAIQEKDCEIVENGQFIENTPSITDVKNNLWVFGVSSWLFGIFDRSIAAFADGYLSAVEITHLFIAAFLFVSWLYLKPEKSSNTISSGIFRSYQPDSLQPQGQAYVQKARARMLELQSQHMISQEYVLPYPYLCQIYHLLNLKHLETIHSFSLNNLRVIQVNHLEPTQIGGKVKFQTVLDSPFNVLRIWRQPIVEVDLTLLTPYTVELSIPVYNDKRITVIFNALPLSDDEHQLFIDIYSDLGWPKPLLQVLLHFASCLTLFEDLPYLSKLAEKNIDRLVSLSKVSNQDTTWLLRRFAHLYGSRQHQLVCENS